jgi:AbrB family looped-hinge helix DNA binding protein
MSGTTVTLSSKGQLALPKQVRDKDGLAPSDVFRLERLGPGKYLIERLSVARLPKAKLVRARNGLMVFRVPKGSPRITREMVKKLEAETI